MWPHTWCPSNLIQLRNPSSCSADAAVRALKKVVVVTRNANVISFWLAPQYSNHMPASHPHPKRFTMILIQRVSLQGLWLVWRYQGSANLESFLRRRDFPAALAGDMLGERGVLVKASKEDVLQRDCAVVQAICRQLLDCLKNVHATGMSQPPVAAWCRDPDTLQLLARFGGREKLQVLSWSAEKHPMYWTPRPPRRC
jgi:hypothetical protein